MHHIRTIRTITGIMLIAGLAALAAAEEDRRIAVKGTDGRVEYEFAGDELRSGYLKQFIAWAKQDAERTYPEDAERTYQEDAVLCIGSSSMRGWRSIEKDLAPVPIIHRGFGGSRMGAVVRFTDFFARYKAGRIVVYEGDNDMLGHGTPEQFIENVRTFVNGIRETSADTEFFFITPKPSVARWHLKEKFLKANAMLKALCDADDSIHYVDVWTPMCDANGEVKKDIFAKDNLHMNGKGYRIWTETVRPFLVEKE